MMTGKVPSFSNVSTVISILPSYLIFCLTLHIHRLESAQFTVNGPENPVVASLGREAVLPCHLSPRMSAETMTVGWLREQDSAVVHVYRDGQDQYGEQVLEYRGRTELLKDDITSGSLSLRIRNIQPSDDGPYLCYFQSSVSYDEAFLELLVADLGSTPVISVEGHQDGGIQVVCRSSGWYPQPEVLWKNLEGRPLPSTSEKISPGASGPFQAEIAIVLKEESSRRVSCGVRNPRLNQESESAISIAGLFFPRVNPWKVPLAVILSLLAVLIPLAGYWFWRQQKVEETLRSEMESETETLLSERDREKEALELALETQKAEYEAAKAKLGLSRAQGYAVDVTLDPDTANPWLVLSEDRKRVRDGDTRQDLPHNPGRFENCINVLGAERLTGGRCYWEVEVGDKTEWELGVCRESVCRKWGVSLSPGNGYWAVRLWYRGYSARTDPPTPLPVSARPGRVGIFLHYEAGEVSFYNVTDGSHLFTFTDTFSGPLRPYFCPGYRDGGTNAAPLTICPGPAQPQGISVPDRDPAAQTGPSQR